MVGLFPPLWGVGYGIPLLSKYDDVLGPAVRCYQHLMLGPLHSMGTEPTAANGASM